eukprot:c11750_g1_i2.p1 GENE.c11750_g1_i2~~c11750_g1_i2.p1  ORF type:complete len:178 (-),score=24.81 c11750_g1_i2:118-651(-)
MKKSKNILYLLYVYIYVCISYPYLCMCVYMCAYVLCADYDCCYFHPASIPSISFPSRASFTHIVKWLEDVKLNSANPNLVTMLIGNKRDLAVDNANRVVEFEEGFQFAAKHGMLFMETSAKTSDNVDEAFVASAQEVLQLIHQGKIDTKNPTKYGVKLADDSGPVPPHSSRANCAAC